ncbi:hypothetical protein TURU_122489 [Turdus rufiventris]|nr:hypothetical protein TURU_122489 [Turdus rufiventris]
MKPVQLLVLLAEVSGPHGVMLATAMECIGLKRFHRHQKLEGKLKPDCDWKLMNVLLFGILRIWSEELVQNQEFQIGYYRSVLQTKFDVNKIWNRFDEIVKK